MWRFPQTDRPGCSIVDAANLNRERNMRNPHESAADRVWKEKLDACASPQEAVAVLLVLALVVGVLIGV